MFIHIYIYIYDISYVIFSTYTHWCPAIRRGPRIRRGPGIRYRGVRNKVGPRNKVGLGNKVGPGNKVGLGTVLRFRAFRSSRTDPSRSVSTEELILTPEAPLRI